MQQGESPKTALQFFGEFLQSLGLSHIQKKKTKNLTTGQR